MEKEKQEDTICQPVLFTRMCETGKVRVHCASGLSSKYPTVRVGSTRGCKSGVRSARCIGCNVGCWVVGLLLVMLLSDQLICPFHRLLLCYLCGPTWGLGTALPRYSLDTASMQLAVLQQHSLRVDRLHRIALAVLGTSGRAVQCMLNSGCCSVEHELSSSLD